MKRYIFIFFILIFILRNFYILSSGFFNDNSHFFNDFYSYYLGSHLFWQRLNPYDLAGDFSRSISQLKLIFLVGTGYSYPPFLAFLFFPLIQLPPHVAARIFAIFSMILYCLFCFLILRARKKFSFLKLFILAGFLATFYPAIESANHGQVNIIVLFCIYLYFKYGDKDGFSPFLLVSVIFIKVYPIFFLVKELLEKKIKFVIKCLFWAFFIVAITSIFHTFDLWKKYFTEVLPTIGTSFDKFYTNQSLNGFLSRLLFQPDGRYLMSQADYKIAFLALEFFIFLGLVFLTLQKKHNRKLLYLIWLGTISLLAGKNSFANFTPCILIGIFLIDNWDKLARLQKLLFIFSIFLSNYAWQFVYDFNKSYLLKETASSKIYFLIFSSLGFIYLVLQVSILFSLSAKNTIHKLILTHNMISMKSGARKKYYAIFTIFLVAFILAIGIKIYSFQTKSVIENSKTEVKIIPHAMKKLLVQEKADSVFSASIDVPILMYHYVEYVTDKRDTIRQSLNVNPNIFEDQIKTLQNAGYTFLTASELADILDDKRQIVAKPILLTFDDGHNDLVSDVLPILKKYQVRATMYMISGFLDRLDFLTTEEMKTLVESKMFEIGAHTVNHVSLAYKFAPIVKYEVETSKKDLEKIFGIKVVSFAFPNGAFDEHAAKIVKEAGFTNAVATVPGERQSRQNRFFLSRIRPGYLTGQTLLDYLEREKLMK
jgi:peptidoglycan/xylan/chitin deacetylase (PgdA/CDA1 family)